MSSVKKTSIPLKSEAQSLTQKRRNRRKRAQSSRSADDTQHTSAEADSQPKRKVLHLNEEASVDHSVYYGPSSCSDGCVGKIDTIMMENDPVESRDKVKAAREAKKFAKQQSKVKKDTGLDNKHLATVKTDAKAGVSSSELPLVNIKTSKEPEKEVQKKTEDSPKEVKSKDEVDRAAILENRISLGSEQDKEKIKAERAAKKAANQAKKKGAASGDIPVPSPATVKADTEMTVRDVVQTLRDIKMVALEVKAVTAQVQALNLDKKEPEKKTLVPKEQSREAEIADKKTKPSDAKETAAPSTQESEDGKSKAQLRAERRAKQEAQRAAKEGAAQAKAAATKPKEPVAQPSKEDNKSAVVKEKSPKPKTAGKQSTKQPGHRVNWFRHTYNDDKAKLDNLPINSNLHPAIIKLGVQLATRVVTGSNARCVALLDALKQMVRDYSLPARTEFKRGLEAHLASSLQFVWRMRQPTASQTNAVKFFRHHLTQLPNNVDEFDAKKTLVEEIERYIREQIDMAGEAISITVRSKISENDVILTYGCSSLIERILVEAHSRGVSFRAVVAGGGTAARAAREMTRRLAAARVPCICVDILAIGFIMHTVNKVLLGASALLANGSVLGAAGTGAVALAARGCNVPVLVACETHKFSERVQTDAFVYNEIGDPDELIDKSDDNSPLKDWRSNPNLTPLNLTYDVTPPNLVTAVVTELAILPCTSAPVVLRFKLSEYSV